MLAKWCSKFFKLGFDSMWTKNFQMYKLDSEKAEEPEIKLPTSVGSYKKQRNSRKIPTSASLVTLNESFDCVGHDKLWKILKEMKIPDHLTYLLRNLCAGQKATARSGHRTTDWFKIGKGVNQACISLLCSLTSLQSISCKMPGWMKNKLESKWPGEISTTSDMQIPL